ncbi:YfcE family phosphodiesterase [Iocasia frigidifontis]|uniref:Phosphoesterase n=1 Tax=Iocasia fonsfrigidae TaxID=2682810 RepID=A0A8A7KGX9_9FIRM|nr:metallophosphoesterase family protein [Iocasia fonsfrigidae]QTL98998.1 YfcE family phosphodiesterase [Iocasia fonsfrigidae]
MKIGVISDTHIPSKAKKIPDIVFDKFRDIDLIIHAGDITSQEVLDDLAVLAPVKAVYGNVDPPELCRGLPERLRIELNGYQIGVTHGHNLKGHIMERIAYVFPKADIIIFGHTHRPCNEVINGQLYFNPGSATDRRLQAKHSIGIITLHDRIEREIIYY